MSIRQVKFNASAFAYAGMIKLLVERRITKPQIVEETGLHKTTVYRYVNALWAQRIIYICGWEKDTKGRDTTPIFAWGDLLDVPRSHTRAEGARRARKKLEERAKRLEIDPRRFAKTTIVVK